MTNQSIAEEFAELALQRHSCRHYDTKRPVSDEAVLRVLEFARISPSAHNEQPWHFVVVRDSERRAAMLVKSRPSFNEAPVLIVACGVHDRAWHRTADGKDHTDIDVAIAVQQMQLGATALGLSTCWICSFDTEAVRRAVQLPDGVEPIALMPLGYAAEGEIVPQKVRKNLDEIYTCEVY